MFTFIAACGAMVAQAAPIDLTQDATVRQTGQYTYYSRASASPYTDAFHPEASATPGGYAASQDSGHPRLATGAPPIAFAVGDLTDNTLGSGNSANNGGDFVFGFTGFLSNAGNPGRYDILFDLGGTYRITGVEVVYSDIGGGRWTYGAGDQQVWTTQSFAGATPADSDFTAFATATAVNNQLAGTLAFTSASPVDARYVNIRPQITSPNFGSGGGILHEVRIFGEVIPEPASLSLIAAGALIGLTRWNRW